MEVKFTKLLREKGAGLLQGKKLKEFAICANASRCPLRDYRPRCGESWKDVYKRAKNFFITAAQYGFRGRVENIFDQPRLHEKILAITHGGFVMEAINYVNYKMEGTKPVLKNVTKNCSLTIVRMYCKKNLEEREGICSEACGNGDDCLAFEFVSVNDTGHMKAYREEIRKKKEKELMEKRNIAYKKKIGSLILDGVAFKESSNISDEYTN